MIVISLIKYIGRCRGYLSIFVLIFLFSFCQSNERKISAQNDKMKNAPANIFETGDVLVFQYPDSTYGITILLRITRSEDIPDLPLGVHVYDFCRTTFRSSKPPTIDVLKNVNLIGHDAKRRFWEFKKKVNFYAHFVSHKSLESYSTHFQKIGNVDIDKQNYRIWATTSPIDFQSFCDNFSEYEQYCNQYTVREYPLADFIQE